MESRKKFIPVCEPIFMGNELEYVMDAARSRWISSSGKYVSAFEEAFADYCGVKYAVGVCNGTAAMHLALVCLDIGPGDEVILPDFTMIASAFAIIYTGAKPVCVDASRQTWNIDAKKIEAKITSRTKAIMPVHIFGNPCDMTEITRIAKKYNLSIVEDAAESHGASYQSRKTGSLSNIAGFSFYANKNITTGEGGMVVTNDSRLCEKARYYKNLCFNINSPRDYKHNNIGFNYRLSNIHAAIGLAQVENAELLTQKRIRNGLLYRQYLNDIDGIVLQEDQPDSVNVFWMNGILVQPEIYGRTKDQLITRLSENGIDTRQFFTPMHEQPSLLNSGCDSTGSFPIAENLSCNGLYLPSGSDLHEGEIEFICSIIRDFHVAS